MFICSTRLYKALLITMSMPLAIFSSDNTFTKIEDLISQKKYFSACREMLSELREDLNGNEKKQLLAFASNKAFFLAHVKIDPFAEVSDDDEVAGFDWDLADVVECIIEQLADTSLTDATKFTNDILQATHNNMPYVAGIAIHRFFLQQLRYCRYALPSFDTLSQLIETHLVVSSTDPIMLFMNKLSTRRLTVHNILGLFQITACADQVAQNRDFDVNLVAFGKKQIDLFFNQEQALAKKKLLDNYLILKKQAEIVAARTHEQDNDDDDKDELAESLLHDHKDVFIKKVMDSLAGVTTSLALSTALLMKRDDAIVYIKNIYNKLMQNGYSKTAEGLKKYVNNPPTDENADKLFHTSYYIENPQHTDSEKRVTIPQYLQQAFVDLKK